MNLRVAGRRALVTGSSSGIGCAIVEALAREGAHVILNGRSKKNLDAAVRRLQKAVDGAVCDAVEADASAAEGARRIVAAIPEVGNTSGRTFLIRPTATGWTSTSSTFCLESASWNKSFFTVARPTSIIQRLAEPQEVAAMVVYACSDLASATTGATLRVEGGIVTGLG